MKAGEEALVTSKDYDELYWQLFQQLEQCGYAEGRNCKTCQLSQLCIKLYDSLANRKTHYRLTQDEYDLFMETFKSFSKQTSFVI